MTDTLSFVYPPGEDSFHRVVLYYLNCLYGDEIRGEEAFPCNPESIKSCKIISDMKIIGVGGTKEAERQARASRNMGLRAKRFHRTPIVCRESVVGALEKILGEICHGVSRKSLRQKARNLEQTCYDMVSGDCQFPAFRYSTVLKCTAERVACVSAGGDAALVLSMRYGQGESQRAVERWLYGRTRQIVQSNKSQFKQIHELAYRHDYRMCSLCNTWQSGNGTIKSVTYECWNCGCKNKARGKIAI